MRRFSSASRRRLADAEGREAYAYRFLTDLVATCQVCERLLSLAAIALHQAARRRQIGRENIGRSLMLPVVLGWIAGADRRTEIDVDVSVMAEHEVRAGADRDRVTY